MKSSSLIGGMLEWNKILNYEEILVTNELRIIRIEKIGKGCLSYIFCSGDEAMIIDSLYPISYYVDLIKVKKLKITDVVDTNQHADHISASRELAHITNSKLHVSEYEKYSFDANHINENTKLNIGNKEIKIIHAPCHTIGSLCLIIDMEYIFSSDVISFNGVGRPDLHENSIILADKLYHTLHNKILNLPEHIKIFPAHQSREYLINCDKNKIKYITIKDIKKNKLFGITKNEFIERYS